MASEAQARAPAESADTSFDFRVILRLLLQQKWIILGVFAAVMVATIFATLGTTKIYEASATLEYDPTPPTPLGNDVEDVAAPSGNFLAGKEWYSTQNAIIASRTIARKVVERLALHRDPEFMNVPHDQRGAWKSGDIEAATDALLDSLTVKQERDTRVTRISVRSSSRDRSALLANSIADAYMDWVMEERLGSTVRAVDWLSGQLDDVSKRLGESEHELYNFRRKNNVLSVSLADQRNSVSQTIQSFSSALTDTTTRRIQVQAKLRQLEQAMRDDPMAVHATLIAESSAVAELRTRYHEAIVDRDSLAPQYGANHPEMRRIQARIDTIVSGMKAEIQGLVDSMRAELREVEDVERGLQRAKQETQNQGLDLNLQEIDYNRMERERANNEKLHSLLLQRTTEANLTRMLRVSPVRMVDRAPVPGDPIRPRPLLNVAVGCLLGLLLGVGLAVLRMRMDRSVSIPDDLTALGVTTLGIVPTIQLSKGEAASGGSKRRRGHRRSEKSSPQTKDLIVHTHPRSAVAECCRTIRTNLAFMSTDSPLRSVVVTSPGPAEGKSTVVVSLAITMAHSGRRVLLVDTDLRRPRIHKAFSTNPRLGITSILAGDATIEQSVQSTIVDGLSLLPCGPVPPNPSELLHTAKFAALLEDLKQRYDLLVFDSPPVSVVIDAAIIGPQLDGVILVAESGRTSRDALAHSLRQLRDVGSKMLGCVLNDVDLSKQSAYGYYYYYSGGYYYSSNDESGKPGDGGASMPPNAAVPPPAE